MPRIYIADNNPLLSMGTQLKHLSQHWGWVLGFGCLYLLLGVIAFATPVASSIALATTLGALLFVSGIIQLIHAIQLRHESGSGGRFFQSILSLVAGGLMLRYPNVGLLSVAITLAFYFFLGAFSKWVMAFAVRPNKGWIWILASAIASIILGGYIVANLPLSALWIPGVLLGIDFVIAGLSMIRLSTALRQLSKEVKAY